MLAFISSSRALFDRWREPRGSLTPARPISGAITGVGPALEALGGLLALKPVPFLVAIGIVTVLLGAASTQIETEFNTRDLLPSGGDAIRNIDTLDAAFGGSSDLVTVMVEAEITDDRTVRNIFDFSLAFSDDLRRPEGVVSEIQASLGLLLFDWITDEGTAGDKYDAQLLDMYVAADEFRIDPPQIQAIVDHLEELDPDGFSQVAVDDPNGPDTLLIQFEALNGDQERAERMVNDIQGLWFGKDEEITAISDEVVGLEVVNAMTESQTASITITILAALTILCLFFWITEGRPALGFIAVGPIVLVLIWVLGTMALLGIPYNVITALITALSIGIGVDYTIHITHRYEEEFAHTRDPRVRRAADSRDDRFSAARLGADHCAGLRGVGPIVADAVPTVRHRHCNHYFVRADRRHRGGSASDDPVGRIRELPVAERSRSRGARARRRSVRAVSLSMRPSSTTS